MLSIRCRMITNSKKKYLGHKSRGEFVIFFGSFSHFLNCFCLNSLFSMVTSCVIELKMSI